MMRAPRNKDAGCHICCSESALKPQPELVLIASCFYKDRMLNT